MAAKRLTLEWKTTRTSFEDLPVAYSKTQARCQSDYNQPRYNELNILSWQEMSTIAVIFQDGGQMVNFRAKAY